MMNTQIKIVGFGDRLKQERERLEMSVQDFAQMGKVNRITQARYETGVNYPTVEYLYAISQNGVDTIFLLTGLVSTFLIDKQHAVAFSQAVDHIDRISKLHNFTPPPEFRLRAVSQIYQLILKSGAQKVFPTLEELLDTTDLNALKCLPNS